MHTKRAPYIIEFDRFITPDGLEYDFHNGTDKTLLSFTGQGMPDISYITQERLHGEEVTGFRLNPRTMTYTHRVNTCSRNGYWEARDNLINFLRPNRQNFPGAGYGYKTGTLRKILPDMAVRDIDVVITNGPVYRERDLGRWDEFSIQETLQFRAPDPTFYDPVANTTLFTGISVLDHLIFSGNQYMDLTSRITFNGAFQNIIAPGLIFGGDILTASANINYTGTWLTYPTIVVTGPISNFSITNLATNEKIELTYNIPAKQVVTISLVPSRKTVTDNLGKNLIGVVTEDSDLATFAIVPEPQAVNGVNTMSVNGANGVIGETSISIQYNTRYIGI